LEGLHLDKYVDDTSYEDLYLELDEEINYDNSKLHVNEYCQSYNTDNLTNNYTINRFGNILKTEKNKSRYDDGLVFTCVDIRVKHTNNPDANFMKAYDVWNMTNCVLQTCEKQ
jgi:hypothetical protein